MDLKAQLAMLTAARSNRWATAWPTLEPAFLAEAERAASRCGKVAAEFEAARSTAEADASLSSIGRQRAIEQAAAKALCALGEIEAEVVERRLAFAQRTLDAIFAGMMTPKPADAGQAIAAEMRAAEVRAMVRALGPLDRAEFYAALSVAPLDAATREMLDAIENAPPIVERVAGRLVVGPLVDPEKVAERRLARAAGVAPAGVELASAHTEVATEVKADCELVRGALFEAAPGLRPTAFQKIA